MGIQSLSDIDRYGLTLVLGGGEVSLIDITGAYGTFANEGIRNLTTGILRIEDSTGNIVEEFTPSPLRVLSDQTALRITDILSDNEARAPAFGNRSFLYFSNRDVAVKTGTTNDYRDNHINISSFGPRPRFMVDGDSPCLEGTDHLSAPQIFLATNLLLPCITFLPRHTNLYSFSHPITSHTPYAMTTTPLRHAPSLASQERTRRRPTALPAKNRTVRAGGDVPGL